MKLYRDCTITTLYHSDEPSDDYPCTVKLEEEQILVEYENEQLVQYTGTRIGDGHFELQGNGFNGRASLHMFPGSTILEGSWVEEGHRGMWRIELDGLIESVNN